MREKRDREAQTENGKDSKPLPLLYFLCFCPIRKTGKRGIPEFPAFPAPLLLFLRPPKGTLQGFPLNCAVVVDPATRTMYLLLLHHHHDAVRIPGQGIPAIVPRVVIKAFVSNGAS